MAAGAGKRAGRIQKNERFFFSHTKIIPMLIILFLFDTTQSLLCTTAMGRFLIEHVAIMDRRWETLLLSLVVSVSW
jgi:hypothetical protein